MNKNQFISLLHNPAHLTAETIPLLDAVVKEFPYFQTAHLLYTKNLYDQNSMHYSTRLKLAAAYVADRKVLYSLIHNESKRPELTVPRLVVVEEKEKTNVVPLHSITTNNIVEEKQATAVEEEKTITKAAETLSQEIEKKDIEIVKLVLEVPVNKEEQTKVDAVKIPELEKDIINHAIDASIKLEVEELPLSEQKEPADVNIKINEEVRVTPDSRFSFSDWLKLSNPDTPTDVKKKLNYTELIEKFIVQEPKMTRPAATFYSPVDKARKSVVDNYEIVTETLAKIYEKQGNYPKAIKVYESLRLKYPGKSAYFAARITEIEKLINR